MFNGSRLERFTRTMGASLVRSSLGPLGQGDFGTYQQGGTVAGMDSLTLRNSLPISPAACQTTIASSLRTSFDVTEDGATLNHSHIIRICLPVAYR